MGFIESAKKFFGKSDEKPLQESLEGIGIKILADQKLKARINLLQELMDDLKDEIKLTDPSSYVVELDKRLEMLNRAIHTLAAPYYRSGSNPAFRQMMEGWVLWFALAKNWVHVIQDRIKSIYIDYEKPKTKRLATIEIRNLVRRLHSVLLMHVFQDGMLVLAESYLNADVSATQAIVVKTLPPPRLREDMTGEPDF